MAEMQKPMSKAEEEKAIADWELLFPTPTEAKKFKTIANQLIRSGLGKRKNESDLEFCLRIQYCLAKDIPLCFVNSTYIIEGKVNEMVDLKMWRFHKAYPNAEFIVKAASPNKMIKIGRISEKDNWVKVEWSIDKAKKLRLYHQSKAQWTDNPESMLNARCNGQLIDILGGLESAGVGFLSTEEINNTGIDVVPIEQEIKELPTPPQEPEPAEEEYGKGFTEPLSQAYIDDLKEKLMKVPAPKKKSVKKSAKKSQKKSVKIKKTTRAAVTKKIPVDVPIPDDNSDLIPAETKTVFEQLADNDIDMSVDWKNEIWESKSACPYIEFYNGKLICTCHGEFPIKSKAELDKCFQRPYWNMDDQNSMGKDGCPRRQ